MILDSQGGRKRSSHPNTDTPPWQTSILMTAGFVVATGSSPTPLCSRDCERQPPMLSSPASLISQETSQGCLASLKVLQVPFVLIHSTVSEQGIAENISCGLTQQAGWHETHNAPPHGSWFLFTNTVEQRVLL